MPEKFNRRFCDVLGRDFAATSDFLNERKNE